MIHNLADRLPWFGEPPFEPTPRKRPPRVAVNDAGYVRRVLVSWLIGRPVSEIAKRAGCSPRLVHKILTCTIYELAPTWGFDAWVDLGLIGAVDGPDLGFEPSNRDIRDENTSPFLAPVICLVCHRWIGGASLYDRQFDGSYIGPDHPDRSVLDCRSPVSVQGHLLCHFLLQDDPIPIKPPDPWDELRQYMAPDPAVRAAARSRRLRKRRSHWSFIGWAEVARVVDRYKAKRCPDLLPVWNGRPVRLEPARRWWTAMLRGPEHAAAARPWGAPTRESGVGPQSESR